MKSSSYRPKGANRNYYIEDVRERGRNFTQTGPNRTIAGLTVEQTTKHLPTNNILIFATEAGVKLIARNKCWCGDGTFKIVSFWYQQLFTPHLFMLPVVYCLTVKKDLRSNSRIFEVLHSKTEELGIQLAPTKFVCDFETALIPANQGNYYLSENANGILPVNLVPAGFEILNLKRKFYSSISSESSFQLLKFRFGISMVWLCGPTTIWKVGTVARTTEHLYAAKGLLAKLAYRIQQRLHRNEISIGHILRSTSYHTLAPFHLCPLYIL
ncbi:hypothetical protein T01_9479 [Trichinella spiralis]|uniref:MULE transposase domain-containing protein n=1 Tax=Trichinella spiralis TaxID=6334 RepID=A0A0V1B8D7_TRISP|nr:hypothetical protein T01_9479 [Trichinella spiralis]